MKSFQNHIDPEKEEQLRRTKIDVENKVKRILKLAKGINGSKEGNLKKELIHLAEDFHQHYESLYSLYEDLRGEARNNVNTRDDGSSSPPSDSEVYYSPVEVMHKNNVHNDDEASDVEDTILKDKLTSSSEIKEAIYGSHSQEMNYFRDLRVQEEEPRNAAQTRHLEGEVERLKFEVRSLSSQKRQWQEQIESKATEVMQMKERISRLKGRVLELESTCREKERLQHEVETLSHEKGVLEERLSSEAKERSIEVEGMMEQVEYLHEELVSVNTQKAELELLLKMNGGNKYGEGSSKAHVKDSKLDTRSSAKTWQESNPSGTEKHDLLRKMSQLQTSLMLSERKLSAQEKKFKQSEEDSSAEIKSLNQTVMNQQNKMEALHQEINSLRAEVERLKKDKERYVTELEREREESTLIKSKMDKKNTELIIRIADQQKTLLELGEVVEKLKTGSMKANPNFQLIERKIEEMAEEFKKHLEDKCRNLSRRIRAAEKLHLENKEWFVKTNEEYKHENKAHQGRMETGLKSIKDMSITANDVLVSLDSIVLKFEECNENFLSRISKTSCEVNYAKEWARRKNDAVFQVKHDLDELLDQLDEKEGEILVFRERVRKLENKLRDMEKWMREKDNGMMELHEEKREAIRQLCVWIDYHRCRTDYYRKMMKRMPETNPQHRRVY